MVDMISPTALSATKSAAQIFEAGAAAPAAATDASGGVGFDGVLKQVASDAIGTLKAGESAAISGIQGKESTRRVVEALMSAEQALQTAVAIRDKVVQAYQEVVRMSI
jgi:flagellar hook-basal body complex protein FliE